MNRKRFTPSFAVHLSRKSLHELCDILQDVHKEDVAEVALDFIKKKHIQSGHAYVLTCEKRLKKMKESAGIVNDGEKL